MRSGLLVVALVAALAGCGSGSAKPRFIGSADAICKNSAADLGRISKQLKGLDARVRNARQLYAKAAKLTHRAAVREAHAAAQLSALSPPASDAQAIAGWLSDLRSQAALTEQAAGAFASQNPKGAGQAVQQITPVQKRAQAFSNKYGMHDCGRVSPA